MDRTGILILVPFWNLTFFPSSITSKVTITANRKPFPEVTYLPLCEVQTIGETVCPEGKYGLWCGETCSCTGNAVCHPVTGVCGSPCPTGTYFFGGYSCSFTCRNCKDNMCDQRTGRCFKCSRGYMGVNCDIVCSPGSYGENCEKNCSKGCIDTCNGVNGTCTCKTNFAEGICDDCDVGYYGHDCQLSCSSHCLQGCDRHNGSCACSGNYDGLHCADCRDGFYGTECMYNCSNYCSNVCDKKTGSCSCLYNYGGPLCEDCAPGFYGHDCFACSDLCSDVCDYMTGECSCKDNYHGLHCAKCKEKYYGTTCESKCPPLCANRTCNKISGNCFSCKVGYNGPKCEDKDTGIFGSILFLFLIIAILALALLGLILVACKQRKSDRPVKEDN